MKTSLKALSPDISFPMAVPTAAGMLFQALYFFVDLYFIAGLGDAAVAGVNAAGNAMIILFSLSRSYSLWAR